jgi:hypothetical protein
MLVLGHLTAWLRIQKSQPRPDFLQVSSGKLLGKPAIHRSQELPGCGRLALAVPQPTQALGGSQF